MKNISKAKYIETCLVISTGFLILWLWKKNEIFIWISVITGLSGIVMPPLARAITWIWFKIADILGAIVPRLVLSLLYFLFLFPIALLHRVFAKSSLQLKKKKPEDSYWVNRNHTFTARDLENPW